MFFFSNELHKEENKNLDLCLNELKSFYESYKMDLNSNLETSNDLLTINSYLIEYLGVACEHFSLKTCLFLIAVHNLSSFWQERCSKKKSSKKKKQFYLDFQTSVDKFFEIYDQLCSIHQFTIDFLNKMIKSLNSHQSIGGVSSINDEILVEIIEKQNEKCEYLLNADIKESYIEAYQQLLNQFSFKLKQLQQLIQ